MTFVAVFLLFSVIILVHEFGHYIMALASGVQVVSFNIGFGPVLFSKKKNGTLYAFRWLPFGGFVQLAGLDESMHIKTAQNKKYSAKTIMQRVGIIAAGSVLNVLLAVLIFIMIYSLLGIPKGPSNVVGYVVKGSSAQAKNIQPGDKLISVNGRRVVDVSRMVKQIHNTPAGEIISVQIERGGVIQNKYLAVSKNAETKSSYIGVVFLPDGYRRLNIIQATLYGFQEAWGYTRMFVLGLGSFFSKTFFDNVSGPVGIINVSAQAVQQGWIVYFKLMAILSLNIGLLNILPFPALDGGRLVFILYEAVFRRKPNPDTERVVHLLGFLLLIGLIVMVTYQDILRLWQ